MLDIPTATLISQNTDVHLALYDNGQLIDMKTHNHIPPEHVYHPNRSEPNGYVQLSAITCGTKSGCFIGDHKKGCSGYQPSKCAKYSISPYNKYDAHLSIDVLGLLIQGQIVPIKYPS